MKLFSPNMLKTFEFCPKKFHFRYVKNISMPIDDSIFLTGKNIHALASYYLRKENITLMEKELTTREKEIWAYLKSLVYMGFETIATEYNLSVKIGDYFFGGRLDALVKDNNTYYILDYKTGSAPKDAKYDFQTMIYILSVSEFFKTDKVIFIYLDLKNKTESRIELNSELKDEYIKRLNKLGSKIEKSDYKAVTKECNKCEYKVICYDKKLSD